MATAPILLSLLTMTAAASGHEYSVQFSLLTHHFNPRPEHNNTQQFKGIERHGANYFSRELEQAFPSLRRYSVLPIFVTPTIRALSMPIPGIASHSFIIMRRRFTPK